MSLDKIKQMLQKRQAAKSKNKGSDEFVPYYQLDGKKKEKMVLRFLYPKDMSDEEFSLDDSHHKLLIGYDEKEGSPKYATFACNKLYGEACPACAEAKKYYDADDEDSYKLFKRSSRHLYSVYVVSKPDSVKFEKPVGVLRAGFATYKNIDDALSTSDAGENEYIDSALKVFKNADEVKLPIGFGFNINYALKSSKKQKWNDYSSSGFDYLGASDIEEPEGYEPVDLTQFRTKKISAEEILGFVNQTKSIMDTLVSESNGADDDLQDESNDTVDETSTEVEHEVEDTPTEETEDTSANANVKKALNRFRKSS